MGTTPQFVATPNVGAKSIVNADGTTVFTVFTAGSGGSRIEGILATHNDATAAVIVKLYLNDGVTAHLLGMISMAVATGAVPFVTGDLLQSAEWVGVDPALIVPSGYTLQAGLNTAITAGATCSVMALGGDF